MNLEDEFIKCRDALACAMNWLDQEADLHGGYATPTDTLEWLTERLDKATTIADKIAATQTQLEDINEISD